VSLRLFVQKDLKRIRRDPAGLLLWICIPLVIGSLIALATGGGGPKLQVPMLVDDQDKTFASDGLQAALGMVPQRGMIQVEGVDAATGAQRLRDGEASALLMIPKGFEQSMIDGTPMTLTLLTNPAQRVLPGIAEGVLRTFVDAIAAGRRVLRPELLGTETWTGFQAKALVTTGFGWMTLWNEQKARFRKRLDPLAIEVVDKKKPAPAPGEVAEPKRPQRSFGAMLWPGTLLMALFFVAQGLGEDLWEERRLGTLRRVLGGPAGLLPWLLGKLLAGSAVAALVGAAGLSIGALCFGMSWSMLPLGIAWVALSGMAMLLLFWPVMCLAGSAHGANVLSSTIGFPLLMVGGSFFPFEAMPKWLGDLGRCTPNGWLLTRLRALGDGAFEPLQLGLGVLGIAALACFAIPFCIHRLRRSVTG